jgi:Protein of unknown function (DUF2934)
MAAPRKPRTAGVRAGKGKGKAAKSGSVEHLTSTAAPAAHQNGGAAPSPEMIRVRAFEVFLARGGNDGDEVSDWLTAERELTGEARFQA